jgi:tetratricopeptide (TPR) repeat protein
MEELEKIDLLLDLARDRRYSDATEMVYLCELAQAAADRLEADRHGPSRVADVQARVWAELANAYRLADQLGRSEQALAVALEYFHAGSRDLRLLALLGDRLAALLCHRRRFQEALVLLDRLTSFYLAHGDHHMAGRTLITRGLYTEYIGEPRLAAQYLCRAFEFIEPERDQALVVAGIHNLLLCASDLEYFALADRIIARVEPLYGTDRLNLLRLSWIKGRVAAGLGRKDEAERTFHAVRVGFGEAGLLFPASLASLDLARIWMEKGRMDEITALAQELIGSFRSLRVGREVVASLLLLRRATEQRASLDELNRRLEDAVGAIRAAEARPR